MTDKDLAIEALNTHDKYVLILLSDTTPKLQTIKIYTNNWEEGHLIAQKATEIMKDEE